MWVTIIADASFCSETNVAGYAYWIACERGKVGGEGSIDRDVGTNIVAEMAALLWGLYEGRKQNLIHKGDSVLLQTDCQPAIDAFEDNRANYHEQELELVGWFKEFVVKHELTCKFKHVKGHTTHTEARFATNRICDRRAKQKMRAARNEKQFRKIMEYFDD